jgi:CheY-like chemotaxis protein
VPDTRIKFLIVDDNLEGQSILSRMLLRKFPNALIEVSGDADTALSTARKGVAAMLIHRAGKVSGIDLTDRLRAINPSVPILLLSETEEAQKAALAAGATKFLHYDKWLLVGSIVADLLIKPNHNYPSRAID